MTLNTLLAHDDDGEGHDDSKKGIFFHLRCLVRRADVVKEKLCVL